MHDGLPLCLIPEVYRQEYLAPVPVKGWLRVDGGLGWLVSGGLSGVWLECGRGEAAKRG
jgi:hypothetical protein